MTLATELAGNIAAVLDDPEIGRDAVLRVPAEPLYNAATGGVTQSAPADYDTRVLVLGYRDRAVDGTNILRGDRKIIMRALGLPVRPAPGHFVLVGTDTWAVINLHAIDLGTEPVHFVVQARNTISARP